MNTHTGAATIPFKITDEQLDDFMGLGAGYWARGLHRVPLTEDLWLVTEYADGSPKTYHTFTTKDIISAFERCVANRNRRGDRIMSHHISQYFRSAIARSGLDGTIDAGYIDDDAADVLLQVIIFDDIVYG